MIKLTHPERRLRDLLIAAANTWPRKPDQTQPLTIRFAGGWVRDKLLSQDTADIDVAVNIATGVQFASHVETFIQTHPLDIAERFHYNTIHRNVEQSKHLETATAHFMGLDLDFVNLRSEEYAEHSRIPETMRFGTPKEDAERRDLTINSLFYNLHTDSVEDFTGMGIDDIKNGIIRTPLDPMTTFIDDPLRVLRAARFAARLGFQMTTDVKKAMMDERVKDRLRNHVTIPRKAEEVKKLLKAPHHVRALEIIDNYNLYNHIFTLSRRDAVVDPTAPKRKAFALDGILNSPHPPAESVAAGRIANYLLQHRIAELLELNNVDSTLPWIVAGLAPWRGAVHPNPPKKEPKFCASLITKHELMYGEEIRDIVEDTFERGKMDKVKGAATQNDLHALSRRDAVTLVRELGPHWRMITFTLLIYEMVPHALKMNKPKFDEILLTYLNFVETIYSHHVENAYAVKRLIPGNDLAALLKLKPRQIAEAQEKAVIYQIVEDISTREAMEAAIHSGDFKFP